jgi:hypothetical protein
VLTARILARQLEYLRQALSAEEVAGTPLNENACCHQGLLPGTGHVQRICCYTQQTIKGPIDIARVKDCHEAGVGWELHDQ